MSAKMEFIKCRRCGCEYLKWANPLCRKCWKKVKDSYIPSINEINNFTTQPMEERKIV